MEQALRSGLADCIQAGGPAPDLRESALALNTDSFLSVVQGGALLSAGMPRFDSFSRDQLLQIYAYIRSRARQVLTEEGK